MDSESVDVGQSCKDGGGCGASTERREEASGRRNESKHVVDVWERNRLRKNQRQPDNFANEYRYRKKKCFLCDYSQPDMFVLESCNTLLLQDNGRLS